MTSNGLTRDRFLGGRLALWQPESGYRAGIDPVMLAAAIPAQAGQRVLELGCGAGAAILCLGVRVEGLHLAGVEIQSDYGDLARRNAADAGIALSVFTADLTALPSDLRQQSFDHVMANPPYYRPGAHSAAQDSGRARALGEETPLADWIDVAARRLAPKGYLHVIQRIDRLPELLSACTGRVGAVDVLPISARQGRAPERFILRARKGGRADFRLQAPLVLHRGTAHRRDEDSYTPEISAILRAAAALSWPQPR